MLDVGCGDGHALEFFHSIGCEVLGVEGIAQESPYIVQHDYTTGPYKPLRRFDLVWACEFVEHVEEMYLSNFLATFRAAERFLLMTHAYPGQGGHHHVNEQDVSYWIPRIEQAGFRYDEALTLITRRFSESNGTPWNHYLRSGLAFRPSPAVAPAKRSQCRMGTVDGDGVDRRSIPRGHPASAEAHLSARAPVWPLSPGEGSPRSRQSATSPG